MKCSSAARVLGSGAFIGSWLTLFSASAEAHEKWFYDSSPHPTQWSAVFEYPAILGVGIAVVVTALAAIWWIARGKRDVIPGPEILGATEEGKRTFYALVPLILGIHVGLPLIVLGIKGTLFSPNNALPGPWLYWGGVVEIGLGLSFIYGGLTRIAAAGLATLWLAGVAIFGLEPMLENMQYLGYAAFFFLAGRGPYSMDRLLFPALKPSAQQAIWAMPCLRIGTALGLTVVAFTEKLANPQLASAFLDHYPLNFTNWMGIPMSNQLFVFCAGTTELIIGLFLVFGLFPRVIIITAWLFINMTLTIFNWVELVGHLPLYGVMAMLLVWTPQPRDQELWVQGVLSD
jgi:uncharacterized membrane protein YphA (DoxX/SURF4 family)